MYGQRSYRRRKIKLLKPDMSFQPYEQQQLQPPEDGATISLMVSANKRLKMNLHIENCYESPPITLICLPENGELCMPFYKNKCNGNNGNCKLIHAEGKFFQLFRLLKEAEQSIYACIYRLNSDLMVNELIDKKRSGRKVRVISDASLWNLNNKSDQKHAINLKRLAEEGIELRTNYRYINDGCMHNKYTIIDDKLVLLGSANWTESAMLRNFETVAIVRLKSMVEETRVNFEQIWEQMEDFLLHKEQLLARAGLPAADSAQSQSVSRV